MKVHLKAGSYRAPATPGGRSFLGEKLLNNILHGINTHTIICIANFHKLESTMPRMRGWNGFVRRIDRRLSPRFRDTENQKVARQIMGVNFMGLDEVAYGLAVLFGQHHQMSLATIPVPVEVLDRCRETHILMAGWPVTVEMLQGRFRKRFCGNNPWQGELFTGIPMDVRWHLIRKDPVLGVPQGERAASVTEYLAMTLLYECLHGERLLGTVPVSCYSRTRNGQAVFLRRTEANRIVIEVGAASHDSRSACVVPPLS